MRAPAIAAAFVIAAAAAGCRPQNDARPTTAFDLAGMPVDPLASEAAATVLVFVSTECPISNRYAPTLRELSARYAARDVASFLVYPDPDDDAPAIAQHRGAFAIDLPALRDPDHALVERAAVRVTPEAAVFSPAASTPVYRGRIDDRVVDFGKIRVEPSTHDLRDAVDAVLDGRSPVVATTKAVGCYISDLK